MFGYGYGYNYGFNQNRRNTQIQNLFIEVYKAYPANFVSREDIELTNSIILPPSALNKLSAMPNFGNSRNPMIFRILNIELNIFTHCSVAEFTAEEGVCYLPSNMFERLCLIEGQNINIRNVELMPGTFIKLQPHLTEFINTPDPKKILEYNLRNYFCVTEGDTISVKFHNKIYKIDIIECKPKNAIRTLNCDIAVDFAPPKDYKEHPRDNDVSSQKLTNSQIQKQIEDKNFSGRHIRSDGKNISNTLAQRIMRGKLEKNNEDNYNPRECRIISYPRPSFKYVEL